jgi:hypothetical protein
MKPFVVSLGFWLLMGMFVAIGYAFSADDQSVPALPATSVYNYNATRSSDSAAARSDEEQRADNAYDSYMRAQCAGATGPEIPQQDGSPVYTPAIVLNFTSNQVPRIGICPHVTGIAH